MIRIIIRSLLILGLVAGGLVWNGEIWSVSPSLIATAEAVVGRPGTPVSYAGVARRSTVGVGAPGAWVSPWSRGRSTGPWRFTWSRGRSAGCGGSPRSRGCAREPEEDP